jgi:hypothetical protein
MDRGKVFKKNQNAAYRIYDGQATIVMPELAKVEVLNEIGSLVWEGIDGRRTVDEVIDSVLEEIVTNYQVAPEQARRDILEFLEALQQNGLVN